MSQTRELSRERLMIVMASKYACMAKDLFVDTRERYANEYRIAKIKRKLKQMEVLGINSIPVSVLQKGVTVLAAPLGHLVNSSLASGGVPSSFKTGVIVPKHKGKGKSASDPASYRPISILPAISKVLEFLVKIDLEKHLSATGALPDTQFGFLSKRSTSTTLAAAQAKCLHSVQDGNIVGVLVFDLLAAFDTLDSVQLLPKLEATACGLALNASKTQLVVGGVSQLVVEDLDLNVGGTLITLRITLNSWGKISYAIAATESPQLAGDSSSGSDDYKATQVALNDVARTMTGVRREDHISIPDLSRSAKLQSVNAMAVGAIAPEAWKGFRSSNGPGGRMSLSTGLKLVAASAGILGSGLMASVPNARAEEEILTLGRSPSANPNELMGKRAEQAKFNQAVTNTKNRVWTKMHECGTPSIVIGVALDGKVVYKQGFGTADVENRVLASPQTSMRIASISKAMTMAAVAKLVEQDRLDLDKPIRDYVPSWPEEHPTITTRHIVSHLSGVRHYSTKQELLAKPEEENNKGQGDHRLQEFHIKDKYESVEKALELFKHDELLSSPGDEFHYTTHGFTVLSAVVEKVSGESFSKHMRRIFRDLGLQNTYLDENEPLIPNRARYYIRDENHVLRNAPYVDNSCKWAGGGFVSNIGDLLKFGTSMLYSYQFKEPSTVPGSSVKKSAQAHKGQCEDVVYNPTPFSAVNQHGERLKGKGKPGFLKQSTMEQIWSPTVRMAPESSLSDSMYAMGWMVKPELGEFAFGRNQKLAVFHTGGAVGASSVLYISPRDINHVQGDQVATSPPHGVVVAILVNMEGVNLTQLASEIATEFQGLRTEA
eukprot:maker-scaffold222_size251774-snap-gene-1.22 protein:Tk11445 transcript:maker-scaffold222_size251774-snap-gene-1.22-mRNA-1 annotation:"hypothetical protein BRAFLDRAFT_126051"